MNTNAPISRVDRAPCEHHQIAIMHHSSFISEDDHRHFPKHHRQDKPTLKAR